MLKTTAASPTLSTTHLHLPRCEECGDAILHPREVRVLRRIDRIPEDRRFSCVHASCVPSYVDEHDGTWNGYDLDSIEASWLLPLLV